MRARAASAKVDLPAADDDWITAPRGRSESRLVSVSQAVSAAVCSPTTPRVEKAAVTSLDQVGGAEQRQGVVALGARHGRHCVTLSGYRRRRLGLLDGEQHPAQLGARGRRCRLAARSRPPRRKPARALAEYRSTVSTWKRSPIPTITLTRRLPGDGAFGIWRTRQRRGPISSTSSSWAAAAHGAARATAAGTTAAEEGRCCAANVTLVLRFGVGIVTLSDLTVTLVRDRRHLRAAVRDACL